MTMTLRDVIQDRLDRANGKRRTRLLGVDDVLLCVCRAAKREDGVFWTCGGAVASSYGYVSTSTVCLAVRRADGSVAVDVTSAPGYATTPGRAWSIVAPFRDTYDCSHRKLVAWAGEVDRIIVPHPNDIDLSDLIVAIEDRA